MKVYILPGWLEGHSLPRELLLHGHRGRVWHPLDRQCLVRAHSKVRGCSQQPLGNPASGEEQFQEGEPGGWVCTRSIPCIQSGTCLLMGYLRRVMYLGLEKQRSQTWLETRIKEGNKGLRQFLRQDIKI